MDDDARPFVFGEGGKGIGLDEWNRGFALGMMNVEARFMLDFWRRSLGMERRGKSEAFDAGQTLLCTEEQDFTCVIAGGEVVLLVVVLFRFV